MPDPDWEALFSRIMQRYSELDKNDGRRRRFLSHVENLSCWENETYDYPDPEVSFPDEVHVAYAVCHPDCGVREFIVDGSTQECQRCGRNMFRTAVQRYAKS
jgi:hypothetical protein